MKMAQEQISLIAECGTCVYKRRWWVLAVFCLCAMMSGMSWNTWGPISESIEVVFGWSNGQIALHYILGNLTYIFVVIPVCHVMDAKGLRFSIIVCSIILVCITGSRCITQKQPAFTVLAYIGAVSQGIAGVFPNSGPSLLAAVWFPVGERPTATAITLFFVYFGSSMSYITGPNLVPGPIYHVAYGSPNHADRYGSNFTEATNLPELKSGISHVTFVQFGIAILLFTLVLVCFPNKPPKPPSITASIERIECREAIHKIVRNGPLWLVSLAGAVPTGVASMWISLIDVILKSIGVSQVDAGWMGFLSTTIGCLSGIIIARYSSLFLGRRKFCIALLLTLAALCVLWFVLICQSIVPYSLTSLYVSCILVGIFTHGTFPLFYELASETSYPVGEGVTGGFLSLLHNTFGIFFLAPIAMPYKDITWISWALFGALFLSTPVLLVFPEQYNRSDIDTQQTRK